MKTKKEVHYFSYDFKYETVERFLFCSGVGTIFEHILLWDTTQIIMTYSKKRPNTLAHI